MLPMGIEKFVLTMARWVPQPVKRAMLGRRSAPNRFAGVIHSMLNRLPAGRYPILDCSGPLKGFRMRVDWQKHRTFVYGNWEPEVVEAISRCVSSGMIALDLGAQSGFYSLLLSKLVGPSGTVVAFEPLPANFRILRENVEMNGVKNVFVREEAVMAESGVFELEVPKKDSSLLAGPLAGDDDPTTAVVPAISLDAFAREICRPIDFIKMDVEGAESDVLEGARDVLNICHPTMLIELHNMDGRNPRHDVVSCLGGMGYSIRWIGEVKWNAHILAQWSREGNGN